MEHIMNWRAILMAFVVILSVDRVLAFAADKRVLARNADFERNYAHNNLDWSKSTTQQCTQARVFFIYTYQTCFKLRAFDKIEESAAYYVYSKPRPKLAFSRIIMSTRYYFLEVALGQTLFLIHQNGEIERLGALE